MNTTIRLFYSCQLFLFLCILPSIGLAQFGGKERMYEGFVSLNEGLEETRVITAKFSERLYYNLTLLHQNNELKVADGLRIGMQIRDSVSSLMHYPFSAFHSKQSLFSLSLFMQYCMTYLLNELFNKKQFIG